MRVLFICSGNVFRSQIAEAFFGKSSKKNSAMSAGIEARKLHHAGKKLERECPLVVQLMAEVGIDVSENQSKQMTKATANAADVVVWLTNTDDLPGYLKRDRRLRVWHVSDLNPPDFSKLSRPIATWTKDNVGEVNYHFFRERRDQIRTNVMRLVKEIG
jgi:protein-tyrosine-phosphatase